MSKTNLYFCQLATQSADKLYIIVEAQDEDEARILAQDEAISRGDMDEDERTDPDAECFIYEPVLIDAACGTSGVRLSTD